MLAWGGLIALLLTVFTAVVGHLNIKGIRFLNVKWHRLIAGLAIIIGLAHGIIGILALKGF